VNQEELSIVFVFIAPLLPIQSLRNLEWGTYFKKKSILTLLQDCPDDSNCGRHLESPLENISFAQFNYVAFGNIGAGRPLWLRNCRRF
jgi:hypothetical protein